MLVILSRVLVHGDLVLVIKALVPDSVIVLEGWTLLQRLQSVLNAAARLLYSARRLEHATPLLRQLYWLKVLERVKFRLCVLVHRCLHNKVPPYLAESLHLTTEVDARRRLRSASTSTLTVPSTRRSTIGDRVFPMAVACAWNSLPSSVRTVSSLNVFRDDLKTVLFRASFDDRTWLLPFSLTTDTCNL